MLNQTSQLCLATDNDITYRPPSGWGLKGEAESVVNMWLHAAIPRPRFTSTAPSVCTDNWAAYYVQSLRCVVLQLSALSPARAKGFTTVFGDKKNSRSTLTQKKKHLLICQEDAAELNPDETLSYAKMEDVFRGKTWDFLLFRESVFLAPYCFKNKGFLSARLCPICLCRW